MSECIYDSATSLAKAIRDKQLSAVEVVSTHFERIEAVNGQLNAVGECARWGNYRQFADRRPNRATTVARKCCVRRSPSD